MESGAKAVSGGRGGLVVVVMLRIAVARRSVLVRLKQMEQMKV